MSRIRTIKPEFFTSEDIVSLSPLSRLFYVSLWCEADREGRLGWKPKTFKLRYFPGDNCDIEAMAEEIISAGLIVIYEVDAIQYAEIPTFKTHQVINNRESESILPTRESGVDTRSSGRKEGREGKGREGKGKEGNTRGESSSASTEITISEFIENCKAKNELAIPEDDAIFDWAEKVQMPIVILKVGWEAFLRREWKDAKGNVKKYKDWRAAFRTYCKNPDWMDVWKINRDGEFYLTDKGKLLDRELSGAAA